MTQITPAVWLDPALSRAMAKAFELQGEWATLQWKAARQFHEVMKFNVPPVVSDTAVLPGILVNLPPLPAR
jgi:hypothetical protein